MREYRLAYLSPEPASGPAGADTAELSIWSESLAAAKAAAEDAIQRDSGLFHRIQEAAISDPVHSSVEYSRWLRGLGRIDNPDAPAA